MISRKLKIAELVLIIIAVGVAAIAVLIMDNYPSEAIAVAVCALCLYGSGLVLGYAHSRIERVWREANVKPLYAKVHESPLLSTFYCQECSGGRAWWHCCRHELNLCYLCLLAHDEPSECYYIPAHRASPVCDLRLQLGVPVKNRNAGNHDEAY